MFADDILLTVIERELYQQGYLTVLGYVGNKLYKFIRILFFDGCLQNDLDDFGLPFTAVNRYEKVDKTPVTPVSVHRLVLFFLIPINQKAPLKYRHTGAL